MLYSRYILFSLQGFGFNFFLWKDRFNFPSSLLRSVTVFIETLNLDFRRNSLTA